MKWSPEKYKEADVVGREAGLEMLSRLSLMSLQPKMILDIGCGTGEMSAVLKKQFPNAQVIALDLSSQMIEYTAKTTQLPCVLADAAALPFRDHSIDLIFANFFVPWCDNLRALLKTWRRVLRTDGMLMLTTLGLDTLQTLSCAIDPRVVDMHDLGDCLVTEGFTEPVLDVSRFEVTYRSKQKLCEELQASGMITEMSSLANAQTIEGKWHLNYEVIFAHAFLSSVAAEKKGITRVSLLQMKEQLLAKPG